MCLTPKVSHQSITTFSSPHESAVHDDSLLDLDLPLDLLIPSICEYVDPTVSSSMPYPSTLSVMQFGIRGLLNKQDDLSVLLNKKHINVVLLCETWLNDNNIGHINIPGYDMVCCNQEKCSGGGVVILVKDCLKFRRWNGFVNKEFEYVSIELKLNSQNMLISSVYRPPNTSAGNFVTEFGAFPAKLNNSGLQSIIGMDHNLDFLKHSCLGNNYQSCLSIFHH